MRHINKPVSRQRLRGNDMYANNVKMNILSVTTCLIVLINFVNPLNILGIYPYNGKSHFLVFRVLLRELAIKGHNVTVISHFPEKDPVKNYHDISLAGTLSAIEDSAYPIQSRYYAAILDGLYILETAKTNCEVLLANKDVQDLIKHKTNFDVIVLEQFNSDCALGVAHKLGGPVVATTSNIMMPFHMSRLGIPDNPSFNYFHFLGGGTKPNLKQRIERVIFNIYFKCIHYLATYDNQKTLAKYYDEIPALDDLAKEIKFLLVYHNFVLTGSKLLPANVIEVGGYHVSKAHNLTGDIKTFVENAKHGIIYVSFGSLVKSSSLPSDKINAILEAMNELPQKFIWKWENKTLKADKSKVYFDSWLPQVDILGHPNTLAFFSHAGMGGTTEALYFGVPIVAMPIDGDQPCNAAMIEESRLGVQLNLEDLTKDNLLKAFKKVLDPKFRENVKRISAAWHDRPLTPLDTAVFWIEFAARHSLLTFRTRAADVPLYQYLYLDVIAIFFVIALSILWFLTLCRKICNKQRKSKEKRSYKVKKSK